MGMYADVCGETVRFDGLVAKAIHDLARRRVINLPLDDQGCITVHVIVLSYREVCHLHSEIGKLLMDWRNVDISSYQGVMQFKRDAAAVAAIFEWLSDNSNRQERLVWK